AIRPSGRSDCAAHVRPVVHTRANAVSRWLTVQCDSLHSPMAQRSSPDRDRPPHRTLRWAAAAVCASIVLAAAHTLAQSLGASKAQDTFLRGLLALHNFEYEDANEAFLQAERIDPNFVLA